VAIETPAASATCRIVVAIALHLPIMVRPIRSSGRPYGSAGTARRASAPLDKVDP
jgi:hypothetical protein